MNRHQNICRLLIQSALVVLFCWSCTDSANPDVVDGDLDAEDDALVDADSDSDDDGDLGDGDFEQEGEVEPIWPEACATAENQLGYMVCLQELSDAEDWVAVSLGVVAMEQVRASKYLLPARHDSRLPGLIMNVNRFMMHLEFMVRSFPELFAGTTGPEYNMLILDPEAREFYAGNVMEYDTEFGTIYGFNIWEDPANPQGGISCAQVAKVYDDMADIFLLRPLAFVPEGARQIDMARSCALPDIYSPEANFDYEVYNSGVGYGTIRRFYIHQLADAMAEGAFGWQDILVLDVAPTDIDRVVSGIVTGSRQGVLSHLNIRSAARGTPNGYLRNAFDALEDWDGKLVRLELGADSWNIEEASPEDAEKWWEQIRPEPVAIPEADLNYDQMPGLLEVDVRTKAARKRNTSRFGSKGANLALLYQSIDADYQLTGFLLPFHYYHQFMNDNSWSVDLGQYVENLSFTETVARFLDDANFQSDPGYRRSRLESLRMAMQAAVIAPDLLQNLKSRIEEVFGSDRVMLRFRSSSNAEDSLEFSGAGLYDSTRACLADEFDEDKHGPSLCDTDGIGERTLSRALRQVWASLWNFEAYDEREWYGIDHSKVVMAVLVNTRSKNEQANIVAFTGNPTAEDDDRYLVNAQAGELSVVLPDPGIWPERVLLSLSPNGQVTDIERVRASSELEAGQVVLDDAVLQDMGAVLFDMAASIPIDATVPTGGEVLLDSEWKVLEDGRLIVKQVRPFLKPETY